MSIYIDYTAVTELEKDIGKFTGAGSYTRDLISLLSEHGVNFKILIYKDYTPKKQWEREHLSDKSCLVRIRNITGIRLRKEDILIFPAVTGRILTRIKKIRKRNPRIRIYAVIHDRQHNISRFDSLDRLFQEGIFRLLPVLFTRFIIKKLVYDLSYPGLVKNIDKVFTVSNHTLQALNHKNLKKVTILYQPASIMESTPVRVPGSDETGGFILFVSGGRPEKNLGRALLAFRDFHKSIDTDLKLCVTGIDRKKLSFIADELGIPRGFTESWVRAYDYVDTGELCYLYRNCRYLLFISKGEGFGLPVLEAIEAGKTVLCSRESSIPEVCGGILYYVDAFNVASIRDGMIYLNDDKSLYYREKLVERKRKIIHEQIELDKQVLVDEITKG